MWNMIFHQPSSTINIFSFPPKIRRTHIKKVVTCRTIAQKRLFDQQKPIVFNNPYINYVTPINTQLTRPKAMTPSLAKRNRLRGLVQKLG
jgi:hypothetical protein